MMAKSVKRKILWTIDNVTREKLEEPDFELFSDPFTMTLGDNVTKWKLHMAVPTDVEDNVNEIGEELLYLSVCPRKLSVTRDDFQVDTKMMRGDYPWDYKNKKRSFEYDADQSRLWLITSTVDNVIKTYLHEDKSLKLEIEIELSYPDGYGKNIKKRRKNDYTNFYNNEKLSDFTLKSSDGKVFKVHRLVLADCSEFFEKMVTSDIPAQKHDKLNVTSAVLEDVLRYVYTGDVEIEAFEKAIKLLDAAEELSICGLKALCVEQLIDNLSVENVLKIFSGTAVFNIKELERECLEFIVDNYDKIKETKGFEIFSVMTPSLIPKIMDALANARETIKLYTKM